MKRIITFESIKFIRSRKNLFMIFAFILLLFIQINMSKSISGSFDDTTIHFLEENLSMQTTEYDNQQKLLDTDELSESSREDIEQLLSFRENIISNYNDQLLALNDGNIDRYWSIQKNVYEEWLQESSDLSPEQTSRFQRGIAKISAIQELGLPFEKELNFPLRAWPFLEQILSVMSMTGFIFIVFMLIGDHMSKDFDDGSISLYHSIMRKKENLVIYKGFVITASSYLIVLSVILLFSIGIGFWFGFGSPSYPVIIENGNTGYTAISIMNVALLVATHFLFVLFFLVSLSTLIGIISRHSIVTIGSLILTYYGFTVAATFDFMQPFLPFIPYSQINSYNIVTGVSSLTPQISYWNSILILLIFSLLNIGISKLVLKKIH